MMGDARLKHGGTVTSVTFSQDGRFLVSAGDDRHVRVWETKTGKLSLNLSGYEDTVTAVAVGPDDRWIAFVSADAGDLNDTPTLRLWSLKDGSLLAAHAGLRSHGLCDSIAVLGDGRIIACGMTSGDIVTYDVRRLLADAKRPILSSWRAHAGAVVALAFEPNSNQLMSLGESGLLKAWVRTGSVWRAGRTFGSMDRPILALAVMAKERRVAWGDALGGITLWDPVGGSVLRTLRGCPPKITGMAGAGGFLACIHQDGSVCIWDPAAGKQTARWMAQPRGGRVIAIAPSIAEIATGGPDAAVGLYTRTGQATLDSWGHAGMLVRIALFGDVGKLVSVSTDRSLRVWDVKTGKEAYAFRSLPAEPVGLAVDEDNRRLAVGLMSGDLLVGDLHPGKRMWDAVIHVSDAAIGDLAFAAGGNMLVLCTGDKVVLLALETSGWKDVGRIAAPGGCSSVAAGDTWFAVGMDTGDIQIRDLPAGRLKTVLKEHEWVVSELTLGRTERRLVSVDRNARGAVWKVGSWQKIASFGTQSIGTDGYNQFIGAAISPDDRWVATANWAGRLAVWSATTGALEDSIPVDGSPERLLFDHARIYVGCLNGTVCVYDYRAQK